MSKISLDNIKVGSLSFNALKCLLSSITNSIFASSEYSVLRYSILICAKTISHEAYSILEIQLPKWNCLSSYDDNDNSNNNNIINNGHILNEESVNGHSTKFLSNIIEDYSSQIFEILTPLMEFIDLRRINGTMLADLIEPLEIIPSKILMEAFRFHLKERKPLQSFRGMKRDSSQESNQNYHINYGNHNNESDNHNNQDDNNNNDNINVNDNVNNNIHNQNNHQLPNNNSSENHRCSLSRAHAMAKFSSRKNSESNVVIQPSSSSSPPSPPLPQFYSVRKNSAGSLINLPQHLSVSSMTSSDFSAASSDFSSPRSPRVLSYPSKSLSLYNPFYSPPSPYMQVPPPPPTPFAPFVSYDFKWSSTAIGSKLKIIENGYVLTSHSYFSSQAARASQFLTNGFHEWDIVIEKLSEYVCIGVCGEEYNCSLSYDRNSSHGWYLCTLNGNFVHGKQRIDYIPVSPSSSSSLSSSLSSLLSSGKTINDDQKNTAVEFKKGTVITVHLDMNSKRLGFSVNGRRFPDLMGWNDFPTKVYPLIILKPNSQVRIQSHINI